MEIRSLYKQTYHWTHITLLTFFHLFVVSNHKNIVQLLMPPLLPTTILTHNIINKIIARELLNIFEKKKNTFISLNGQEVA